MHQPDPQAMYSAWTSQFSEPNGWQSWIKPAATMGANPIADILKEAGASINPEALTQLQNDYTRQLTKIWQDLMLSKASSLTDRRFASPAWHSNTLHSFN